MRFITFHFIESTKDMVQEKKNSEEKLPPVCKSVLS